MNLYTERLLLRALTPAQLRSWAEDVHALAEQLDCVYRAEPVEDLFRDIILKQAEAAEKDAARYVWHSFFWLIRKTDRVVVGSADFKAPPDENGVTEIGYGLGKEHEGHGYMGEAVRAMCAWALGEGGASAIVAETLRENWPSQRLLTRCGFRRYREEQTLWWRLDAPPEQRP